VKSQNILFFIFFLFRIDSSAQEKYDYYWLFGGNSSPTSNPKFWGMEMDFNKKPIEIIAKNRSQTLTNNNACISDKNGKLLMYTAGCHIWDKRHEKMPNGIINSGVAWNELCLRGGDYRASNGTLMLPKFKNNNQYFILHKFTDFDKDPIYKGALDIKLMYSVVDITSNQGFGDLIKVDQDLVVAFLSGGDLTAIKHADLDSWWVLTAGRVNDKYYLARLGDEGLMSMNTQSIGRIMPYLDDGGSMSIFSPTGKFYARLTPSDGLYLMDFDRINGTLSNFKHLLTGSETNDHTVSLAFSSNSRFLYLIFRKDLYQVDVTANDLQSSLIHIDTWDGWVDGTIWEAAFGKARLAPDCKIYMATGTSNLVMHVIHNPNEKGKACNFKQHDIMLPAWNHASLPNLVNYRLDTGPVCDSSIIMSWDNFKSPHIKFKIVQNFSQESILIEIEDKSLRAERISIFDLQGKKVSNINNNDRLDKIQIPVHQLLKGIYVVCIYGNNHEVYQQKILID
jgi:hypothetical protein